jgi:hypothetical protein
MFRLFPHTFDRVVVVHVGAVDVGSFKGVHELDRLRRETREQADLFLVLGRRLGLAMDAKTAIGIDVASEVERLVEEARAEWPGAVVFAGQLAFLHETVWTRLLHNYLVFTLQRAFCRRGTPFVIVPVSLP